MKIAILADLHLTDNPDSVKLTVLDRALKEVKRAGADLIIGLGDLTATGTDTQLSLLFRHISSCGIPFYSTPGNAELRSRGNGAELLTILPPENIPVLLADSSTDVPTEDAVKALAKLPVGAGLLLATHCPPEFWPKTAKDVLHHARERRAVTAVIAGHLHDDRTDCLRGLDPDKASGGPPMIAVFERAPNGDWSREDRVISGIDPADWTPEERASFRNVLGFSCMYETFPALEAAAELSVPVVELRYGATGNDENEMKNALAKWRSHGGRILSLHLPSLAPCKEESLRVFREAVDFAVRIGCDRVTLHVPQIKAAEYAALKDTIPGIFAEAIRPLLMHGIRVGIENLHTINGHWAMEERTFGCTIEECSDWLARLREKTGSDLVGFHLDIGHARNNAPFSQTQNVSDWYNVKGLPICGLHFHQVRQMPDGTFKNHAPLEGFYRKLIALGGYFLARRNGLIPPDAPVILEINEPGGGIASYKKLQSLIPE